MKNATAATVAQKQRTAVRKILPRLACPSAAVCTRHLDGDETAAYCLACFRTIPEILAARDQVQKWV